MNDYNSEIYRIWSLLKYCEIEFTEEDLMEETYSTFNVTNIIF